jgi:hypothetical protein
MGVRSYSGTVDVHMVLQSLVVALIHDPEYEGNGCPEKESFRACELGSLARL